MSPREARDGCQCPAWVLQCVHFEGHLLVLADVRAAQRHHLLTCRSQSATHRYSVFDGRELVRARCGCNIDRYAGAPESRFPALPEALAEFICRAEEMRQAP